MTLLVCITGLVLLFGSDVSARVDDAPVESGVLTRLRAGEHEVTLRRGEDHTTFVVDLAACKVLTVEADL